MANYHASGDALDITELYNALKSSLVSAGLTQLHEASVGAGTRLHFTLSSGFVLNIRKCVNEYVQNIISPADSNMSKQWTGLAFNISRGSFNAGNTWCLQAGYPFPYQYTARPAAFFVNVAAGQSYKWAFVWNESAKAFYFSIVGVDGKHGMIAGGANVSGIGAVSYEAWQTGCVNMQTLSSFTGSIPLQLASFNAGINFKLDSDAQDAFNFYVYQNTSVDGKAGWKSLGFGYAYSQASETQVSLIRSNLYAPAVATLNSQAKLVPMQFFLIRNDNTQPYNASLAFEIPNMYVSNATSGPYINGSIDRYGTKRMLFCGNVAVEALA